MFRRIQHVHFVGIGGIGMSGIAEVLVNLGFRVSGSDAKRSHVTDRLQQMGVDFAEGHDGENVGDAHVVVRSTAVRDENPEIVEAHQRSIPVIPRAEMLAELMRLKPHTVAVAGSHGKTTTTSMVATVLGHAGMDPTIVVGGVVGAFGSNAHLGTSDLMVVEADESDRSFLMLTPTIAVVTNIDREHMDYYHDMDDVRACFTSFVNKVPFYGASILCLDDPNVQAIIPDIERRRITYGLSAQADISAHAIRYDQSFGSVFTVWHGADVVGDISLKVPGLHNVYNALAAIAVGFELDVPFVQIAGALGSFTGAGRRFQFKGEAGGVLVVDDYGHHPTEVKATLAAAKIGSGGRRIVVLFQPHRYSRTHDLMEEFARSFNNADTLFVTDIYAASEDPIEGTTAETLTAAIKRFGHKDARYVGALENAAAVLRDHVQPGDLVLTLGAGTVSRVSDELVGLLSERGDARTVSFACNCQFGVERMKEIEAGMKFAERDAVLQQIATRLGVHAERGRRFAELTSLRVGGAIDWVLSPETEAEAAAIVNEMDHAGIVWRALGSGSNILADDGDHHYVVLSLKELKGELEFDGERVSVSAGYSLPRLCIDVARQGLSGIEGLGGIPGTVGGALWMNAGAYGHEIGTVTETVRVAREGLVKEIPGTDVQWNYRHTSFREGELLLGATLRLLPDEPERIRARMDDAKSRRLATQPHGSRSAGCFFKNAPDAAMGTGKMIDEMGMKGVRKGSAVVSPVHANFIVTEGEGALAEDALALAEEVRERVKREHGIELEYEVELWRAKERGIKPEDPEPDKEANRKESK